MILVIGKPDETPLHLWLSPLGNGAIALKCMKPGSQFSYTLLVIGPDGDFGRCAGVAEDLGLAVDAGGRLVLIDDDEMAKGDK